MIRAAVAGIAGRMGSRIAQLVCETEGIELTAGFERPGYPKIGNDLAEVVGGSATGKRIVEGIGAVLDGCDVVIDFTAAAASLEHLKAAAAAGVPMVIGSTGFTAQQMEEAAAAAKRSAVLIAPNMSVGVNVLFQVVAEVARLLGEDFDVEIVEAHHRFKKDAPSGTALKLAQIIARSLGRDLDKTGVYGRHGLVGERTSEEIGVHAVRGGDIVGEHTVMFAGMGERIEIIHRAQSRDNFARGAIRAAKWIVGKPPGIYDMSDVLGLK